ncbi:2-hydroxyacid dehydrogenase [Maribacter halichondriae]|uniref:2-hydroxyacid dehydrogenase n=1 Tax=Maribacter halichondriae TaxID=2980554 RepID=UPI0023597A30|nr:glyoxylate/hydroxypyruvate reductase A [Maribacter sp. Hal144]
MAIVIIRQDGKIPMWQQALKSKAKDVAVYSYLEEHSKDEITMALVWKHPKGELSKYPNLKCIASSGAGVDFIFEDENRPKNLPITRVVDVMLAKDMSEHVIAAIFSYLKNLGQYRIDQVNKNWKPKDYHRISDFTVGILGLGALGSVLANDLVRFGFHAQGWSNSKKRLEGVTSFVDEEQLSDFLSTSEILVCLLPLTDATFGILNVELFRKLPQGAYIINVARGGHVVDADLIEYIDNGHLSGACLDVFHQEPLPIDHPFWEHDKIHMTPHYASVSDTNSVVPQIIENYHRLRGVRP